MIDDAGSPSSPQPLAASPASPISSGPGNPIFLAGVSVVQATEILRRVLPTPPDPAGSTVEPLAERPYRFPIRRQPVPSHGEPHLRLRSTQPKTMPPLLASTPPAAPPLDPISRPAASSGPSDASPAPSRRPCPAPARRLRPSNHRRTSASVPHLRPWDPSSPASIHPAGILLHLPRFRSPTVDSPSPPAPLRSTRNPLTTVHHRLTTPVSSGPDCDTTATSFAETNVPPSRPLLWNRAWRPIGKTSSPCTGSESGSFWMPSITAKKCSA